MSNDPESGIDQDTGAEQETDTGPDAAAQPAGAQQAHFHVEQTAGEVHGKMTGVEIHQFYGEIFVRPESIEDLPPVPGEPPYKGLAYYTEDDAGIAFGFGFSDLTVAFIGPALIYSLLK